MNVFYIYFAINNFLLFMLKEKQEVVIGIIN